MHILNGMFPENFVLFNFSYTFFKFLIKEHLNNSKRELFNERKLKRKIN